jgi:endonuclease/exonuclease/phosphatase family metal-dependent hydrolase
MRRSWGAWALAGLLALPCAAAAQADRGGRWTIAGHEEGWGDHLGWVELTPAGAGQWTVRGALEFAASGARGVLSGRARAAGQAGVDAELTLALSGPPGGPSLTSALAGAPAPGAPRQETRLGRTRLRADPDQVVLRATWDPASAGAGAPGRSGRETWTLEARPGSAVLKVMTFNVKGMTVDWFSREGRIAALIAAEQPDVVALQEVLGVRRNRSLQAARIARRAGGYQYAFQGARAYTPLRLLWMGNAILSRGPLRDAGRLQLTQGPSSLQTFPRAVTHAAVEVRPGAWLHVYSTHLHHRGGRPSDEVRRVQARELLAFMRGHGPGPHLLLGDLNADPDDPCLRDLRAAGLRDCFAEANPGDPRGTNSDGSRRIDYVLVDEPDRPAISGVRVLGAWLRGPYTARGEMISDHHAVSVSAEVRLPR